MRKRCAILDDLDRMHHNINTTQACVYVDLQSIDYMQADPPRLKDSSSIRLHRRSAIR